MEARTSGRKGSSARVAYFGCGGYHKRGSSVCRNGLLAPMDAFDTTVLDGIESAVLQPRVLGEAVGRALAQLTSDAPAERGERLRAELARLAEETSRLSAAIAAGGELGSLLEALRERETRRRETERDLQALEQARSHQLTVEKIETALWARLEDWRGLLRRQVAQGQQILRRLLIGRLDCTPHPEGYYAISGTATVGKLLDGIVPLMVASPAGVDASRYWLDRWFSATSPARGIEDSRRPESKSRGTVSA